jgi:hypothetical protein
MYRRIIATAMATVLFSATGSLHAAPFGKFHHTATDKQTAGKVIHFSIRNASASPLVLKAGDQQYTIEAGKSLSMKLQEGVDVVAVNGTAKEAAGTVVTKVSSVLQNNTLVVT